MGSEISIWVSLLFRLRHKVLKMGQGGQTISDTLLWCIQKWLSSCDPLRASKPCVVLGLRKGNSLSTQGDAFQRHFQRTKSSVTLGHLGTELFEIQTSPEGICLAQDQKGFPVKTLIWAKTLGEQFIVSFQSLEAYFQTFV